MDTTLTAVERMLLESVRREADRLVHAAVSAILEERKLDPHAWGVNLQTAHVQQLSPPEPTP